MPVAINAITSTAGSGNLSPRTDGWGLPAGTNAQRLLGTAGTIRFNTTSNVVEATMDGVTYVTVASAVGPILSITGTANRITVSAGVNPVVDISAAYVGQASITTVGTITSGVWNAGTVTSAQVNGGNLRLSTNQLSATNVNGDIALVPNGIGSIVFDANCYVQATKGIYFTNPAGTFTTSFTSGATLANLNFTWPITDASSSGMPMISNAAGTLSFGIATVPGGGTGIATTTAYGVIVGGTTATGAFQNAGAGLSGQLLQSGGAAAVPAYTTATYPATTTINQLLYSSTANTITGLATLASGTLITSAGGVPSISQTLPAAVQGNITTVGTVTSGVWNAGNVTTAQMTAGNIRISANTIISTNVNGNIDISPDGIGTVLVTSSLFIGAGDRLYIFNPAGTFTTSLRGGVNLANLDLVLPIVDASSSGMPLISNAAGTLSFGVATVPGGGTGIATTTAFGVITGGTTATGAFQNAGAGLAGQLLQSGGAAALPAYTTATYPATTTINQLLYSSAANVVSGLATANNGILVTDGGGIPSISSTPPAAVLNNIPGRLISFQILTAGTGATYTRPAGISSILVEAVGGGGGGGGAAISTGGGAAGGGGASGSYVRLFVATTSATYTYTVGAGGAGGTAGNNNGAAGTASTFVGTGANISAGGGNGGNGSPISAVPAIQGSKGSAGTATGGNVNTAGALGATGFTTNTAGTGVTFAGNGGNSFIGPGATANPAGATGDSAAANSGGGGSGACATNNGSAFAGGNGGSGIIIVWELS